MGDVVVTCERVDEEDLDTRYVTGRLPDAEAAAFEEHFFACDRCWTLVHRGTAVAAGLADRHTGGERPARGGSGPSRRWLGWAALAASVALAVGLWRGVPDRARTDLPDAVRGLAQQLTPTAWADSLELHVAWPRIVGAASYRVRLYGSDGATFLDREVTDTSLSVRVDSLTAPADAAAFWQVFALDRLREEIARSGLVIPTSSE